MVIPPWSPQFRSLRTELISCVPPSSREKHRWITWFLRAVLDPASVLRYRTHVGGSCINNDPAVTKMTRSALHRKFALVPQGIGLA